MSSLFNVQYHPFRLFFHKRQIYAYYDHYLMYFDLNKIDAEYSIDKWGIDVITLNNVDKCANECFSLGRMKKYLLNNRSSVEGFLFQDKNKEKAGFMWLMYPKCNEFQYKVRNVDAFIFDVFVFPQFRGCGLCGHMFQYVFDHLKRNEKKIIALGVRTDNTSAIRAYEKAGGVIKARKRFIQLVHRYNIPYYSV